MGEIHTIPDAWSTMSYAMFMGLRFDTVVSGYIISLPALVLLTAEILKVLNNKVLMAAHIYLCAMYATAFFICAADIPFYHNYSNRLNVSILNWTDSPLFMMKMVWQDNTFLGYLVLFVLISILFIFVMRRKYRRYRSAMAPATGVRSAKAIGGSVVFSLVFLGLIFLGIRGRTDEKSPIVVGTAFFCNFNFPNQAGLNPVFTLMWSWTDGMKDENKKLEFVDDTVALNYVRSYFHLPATIADPNHPIQRDVAGVIPEQKHNVVVVLMESMSSFYLHRFGNTMDLTPNLDSLASKGYSFDNFYSAGIHTFNGIFSSLYSYPALMARHSMDGAVMRHYTGLPYFFKSRGYQTIYFTTHDDQFDNVGGFLSANHMQKIVSKNDYPADQVKSTIGVPDHYMFDFSLPRLSNLNKGSKPFFAVFMTASNHNPYVVPDNIPFKPKHLDMNGGDVEYADWSIGHFMQEASKMPWFSNTIFVFLADHGGLDGGTWGSMPLFYSHIPCIIYSPLLKDAPKVINTPGGQIDLFPTIAGLMGGNYTNNTMGIDLLNDKRQWMFFCQDDKIGVADTGRLYVWQKGRPEGMYTIADRKDILGDYKSKVDSMRTYAFSMIQCAEWLRNNNKTGVK
jgi:phosphoglycerol transferase MdoB-like AlkP superfamily enzyme